MKSVPLMSPKRTVHVLKLKNQHFERSERKGSFFFFEVIFIFRIKKYTAIDKIQAYTIGV